ncbi:hypothetical protein LEP1GSC103_3634 [Leptospira borgpetersenii serovar Javanica str. UI 09931]|uniref:Uncharacterized protein n=4 Tax=Leptospira borgpetersenii TaxID=174 RepID=M3FIM2_LEPBO|nr:hypothetical protein C4Q31_09200 [Leptospira borgpetersenii serovar Ceylonica]EKP13829.1 hypothetical protein LEP1GSC128_0710 [Leptospira borgpetersenii str. 200801926]EKQ93226.1 hypothetical protein LEP1GSC101_3772 [Leptospira borgpetersenii str. UI 09149]EKQ98436.1 hypothetical protein LEP1GSC121_3261 [Leptospira borgpetersenii serovar Castellonis str. 200801910]EMG01668.1 hypothetical protein LEP1GSC123_3494 [Leptospira borgpetersenii str. 200701203]EMK09106.1 hypothetical protein LEP1GS
MYFLLNEKSFPENVFNFYRSMRIFNQAIIHTFRQNLYKQKFSPQRLNPGWQRSFHLKFWS